MELWNRKSLQAPPILRYKSKVKDIDLKVLQTTLQQSYKYFMDQGALHKEAALLSRFIYRQKWKFRSSKDFKASEKLNKALLNYLHLDICGVIKQFMLTVPNRQTGEGALLPSRNMLDYVLVRLQGLGKLILRIVETCKVVCELYRLRLQLGHFFKLAILMFGIASRIFVIFRHVMKHICNLYSTLRSVRLKFMNGDCQEWLPKNYSLPENLTDWLGIDWNELESAIVIQDEEPVVSYFSLIDDSDDDDVMMGEEYILIKDDERTRFRKSITNETQFQGLRGFDNEIDVGEIVLNDSVEIDEDEEENKDNVTKFLKNNQVKQEEKIDSKDFFIERKGNFDNLCKNNDSSDDENFTITVLSDDIGPQTSKVNNKQKRKVSNKNKTPRKKFYLKKSLEKKGHVNVDYPELSRGEIRKRQRARQKEFKQRMKQKIIFKKK